MTAVRTTLVLGGARSGKSRFAEQMALASGLARVYVATATAGDGEITSRIATHIARRGPDWQTVEEPLELASTLDRELSPSRILVVDCLTLWLSNLFFNNRDVERETAALAAFCERAAGPLIFVSNEIGLGLVPETKLGRDFRDAQGRLNQAIATAVTGVAFVAAGLPLWLKHHPVQE